MSTELQALSADLPKFQPQVVVLEGCYHLRVTAEFSLPIRQNGLPLKHLGGGWRFHSLYVGFAPILLFELLHENGERATWYFDCGASFLGNTLAGLPDKYRRLLTQKATLLFHQLLSPVLGRAYGAAELVGHPFFGISEAARLEIGRVCQEGSLPPTETVLAAEFPEMLLVSPYGGDRPPALIARRNLYSALEGDFQESLVTAAREGYLSWPSPIDGTSQRCSGSFCFYHFAFAYRMEDPPSGLVYFLLVSEHKATFLGFYFPSEGLILAKDDPSRRSITALFPNLNAMMVDYVSKYGETLLPFLARRRPKRVVGSMRENHLGHQLWNELSGLEALAASLPPEQLPQLLPLNGPDNSYFGPLDAIFPEFRGKVRNDLRSEPAIIQYANSNDLLLARFTSDFVSAGLRRRIGGHVRKSDTYRIAAARRQLVAGPVVLVGLRVENRTAIDLVGFVTRLVKHIAGILPNALIVLDGQNSNDPDGGLQATTSFMSNRATQSPLKVELEICRQVVEALGPSGISLEIASGKPLASSIAWSELADCVVSFWGAGLAKYRWVANKPTLALSNRYNLLHRGDLPIYSLSRYMSDPTPVQYADPTAIDDDLAAPQLIPVKEPSFSNFRVNEELFFAQVRTFIAPFALARNP